MMDLRRCLIISCCLILLVLCGCQSKSANLWNGKDFTGWKFVLADEKADAKDVWSVKNGIVHCTGVPNGYMRTESDYSNYTLYVEWRWVEEPGNSGVLLHAQVPDQVFPNCIECQLQSGNAGDFVLIGPGSITVDGKQYNNSERFLVIRKRQDSNEKPTGEWNNYKIIAKGDEITCYVNGVLQNSGTQAFVTKGKICLQSEGAPIEFRNIRLEPLN